MCTHPAFLPSDLQDPRKIGVLDVSTALLESRGQYYRGYTLLVLNQHATELYHLDKDTRQRFVEDANRMALALDKTFKPLKMNYCVLGNTLAHLHWHLIPRRESDPDPKRPIWESPFPEVHLSDDEFRQLADEIRTNL